MFNFFSRFFRRHHPADISEFKALFERFQQILKGNNRAFELISELEDKLGGEYIFDMHYLTHVIDQLSGTMHLIVSNLNVIADNRYRELFSRQEAVQLELDNILQGRSLLPADAYVIGYEDVDADSAGFVGGKNANLGEIKNRLKLATPDGFTISTAAFRRFMAENDLWPAVKRAREQCSGNDKESVERYNAGIDLLFQNAQIPGDVDKDITARLQSWSKQARGELILAIRSSAFGEDTHERSFAGQFRSFLGRRSGDVLSDYARILASRFRYEAVAYGGEDMFDETALPMAVGVQSMIDARTAGVAYSVEPSGEYPDCLAISAAYGLGIGAVSGLTDTDYFRIPRIDPTRLLSSRIGRKANKYVLSSPDGVTQVPVEEHLREVACLRDEQLFDLAEHIMMLERYFKRPLDIEWCMDERGRLYILQCRPLRVAPRSGRPARDRTRGHDDVPVILKKEGQIAQRGIAVGKVKQVKDDDDPSEFPVGAIAVTRYTTPRLTSIVRRAAAIITDIGSPSGHMATVAREFGVPMIVGTARGTELLADGSEVTVDAEENVIYRGIVTELMEYEREGADVFKDLKEYKILRHLLRRIWPLSLIDPDSPDFVPRNCRTYHDILRFCHEKAVKVLIDLNLSSQRFRGVESRKLKLDIPLGLHVIDLGDGLVTGTEEREIDSIDKVRSAPMLSILRGLTSPGAWGTHPVQLGFGDLVSSLTRYTMTDRVSGYRGQNLAVISDRYANLSLRLGYHFNVIDTYVCENVDDNYIYFRFVGGVTGTERRHLRATLIKEILEKLRFKVTVSGDLVVARLKKWSEQEVLEVLFEIGRLIGFTRQLDTQMQDEQSIAACFRTFFDTKP